MGEFSLENLGFKSEKEGVHSLLIYVYWSESPGKAKCFALEYDGNNYICIGALQLWKKFSSTIIFK